MKDLKQRFLYRLRLGRTAAIIDIDLIIAYLLFMGLIIAIVQFTLGLITPFSTDMRALSLEKNALIAQGLVRTKFESSELGLLCDELDYSKVRVNRVEYELLGFYMPGIDVNYTLPTQHDEAGVLFLRQGNWLKVIIGSSEPNDRIIKVYLSFNADVSLINETLEAVDEARLLSDEFNNPLISIESHVSNGDLDELLIGPFKERELIIPSFINTTLNNVYVGSLVFKNNCGRTIVAGPQSSFTRYGTMIHEGDDYLVRINGDVGWTG